VDDKNSKNVIYTGTRFNTVIYNGHKGLLYCGRSKQPEVKYKYIIRDEICSLQNGLYVGSISE